MYNKHCKIDVKSVFLKTHIISDIAKIIHFGLNLSENIVRFVKRSNCSFALKWRIHQMFSRIRRLVKLCDEFVKKWSKKQNVIISNKLVFHASITPCLELVEGLPLKKCFPHIKWFFDGIQFEPSLFFRSIAFVHALVSVASFLLALKLTEIVEWVEKTRKSVLQLAYTSHSGTDLNFT